MNRNLNRRIHPIAEADGLSPKKPRKCGISIKSAKVFEELFGVPAMIWLIWDNIDKLNEDK